MRFIRQLQCAIYGYEDITTCGLVAVFKNSFAVNRSVDSLFGRASFMLFALGGVELAKRDEQGFLLYRDGGGLFDVPPGCGRGLDATLPTLKLSWEWWL